MKYEMHDNFFIKISLVLKHIACNNLFLKVMLYFRIRKFISFQSKFVMTFSKCLITKLMNRQYCFTSTRVKSKIRIYQAHSLRIITQFSRVFYYDNQGDTAFKGAFMRFKGICEICKECK